MINPDNTEKSVSWELYTLQLTVVILFSFSLFSGNRISFLEEKTFRNKLVALKYLWVLFSENNGTNSETENTDILNNYVNGNISACFIQGS